MSNILVYLGKLSSVPFIGVLLQLKVCLPNCDACTHSIQWHIYAKCSFLL